ncbi:hypothetical protein PoB_002271000 [Plakobranchus ocellatus]|uniref:Uncharacterized protein n=1 Tax=Plakobranchus ocellatus TaxID=259542 RepID=A0AAV3ZNP8_9GAST|nr:hypothetical protein PoB_002271000 [Plakobranchus ocellatus]
MEISQPEITNDMNRFDDIKPLIVDSVHIHLLKITIEGDICCLPGRLRIYNVHRIHTRLAAVSRHSHEYLRRHAFHDDVT